MCVDRTMKFDVKRLLKRKEMDPGEGGLCRGEAGHLINTTGRQRDRPSHAESLLECLLLGCMSINGRDPSAPILYHDHPLSVHCPPRHTPPPHPAVAALQRLLNLAKAILTSFLDFRLQTHLHPPPWYARCVKRKTSSKRV